MILALLTPFAAFWPPHFLGGSGVLAAVTAGLYTSWNGPRLISAATRLQGFFVWGLAVYLVEGIVFFLMGLQFRVVIESPDVGEWSRMIGAAALTVVVVVVMRFVWVFAASYLPSIWRRGSVARVRPPWQETVLVGFTGIRGVVSLMAALSVPEMAGAAAFPERNLILFVTFGVILISLIGQGAALPKLITFLKLDAAGRIESQIAKRDEVNARVEAIDAALECLKGLEAGGAVGRSVANLRNLHENRRLDFVQTADATFDGAPAADVAAILHQMVTAERASIGRQFVAGQLSDEARRRIERELDLADSMLQHAAHSATGQSFGEL
jgi:CPA1 family monovalent cation:H+ antiporter